MKALAITTATVASLVSSPANAFSLGRPTPHGGRVVSSSRHQAVAIEEDTTVENPNKSANKKNTPNQYWQIAPSLEVPSGGPLTPELREAMETGTHPIESQDELGRGISITSDWRDNWSTYQSPADNPDLIDDATGYACCWDSERTRRKPGVTLSLTISFIGVPTTRRIIATGCSE